MTDTERGRPDGRRSIRSFVVRAGRMTAGQEKALEEFWPKYGLPYSSAAVDLDALFGRQATRVVEIGFGNGENLLALAVAHPERDFIGVEVHRAGVGHLLLRAEEAGLTNLRVICHDAVEVLERHIAPESLDEVLVLFPDPWPKLRHHKNRIIQNDFLTLAARRATTGCRLYFRTDFRPYFEDASATVAQHPDWERVGDPWIFEHETVFQQRAESHDSLVAKLRGRPPSEAKLH